MSPLSHELPRWASEMRDLFRSGSAAQFLLHGNVFDVVPSNGKLLSVPAFLEQVMFATYDVVLRYDRSRGVRATRGMDDWGDWLQGALGKDASTLSLTREPGAALELIEREGVTNFSGVPTMSRELIAHPDWATRDTSSLRGMGGGGAPLQPDLVEKIDKSLGDGAPSTGYGLTETHGIVTANSARFFLLKPASCGPIMPCLDAKLVDDEGNELPAGPDTVGQLCVRGSVVIKGYLNRPEATAEAIVDGWFNTGDVARIDEDGFVFIVDRAKDMVLRGGENVYCSEVESAIYEHDAVAEAAVFGVPDERLGEDVGAVIVLRQGAQLDADELRAFLDGRIAKHKIPASIWFRDSQLPRNANGKFLKRELRAELVGG